MKESGNYSIGDGKITIKKDNHLRLALARLQAISIILAMGGVFLWILLDSTHFSEEARSLALWLFPLMIAFFLLGDLWLFIYLKKTAKEVLVVTKEGIRIEGRKKSKTIKKADISHIYFPTNSFNTILKIIEIDTKASGSIGFGDVAIPAADIPLVKKAIEALLEL